MPRESKTVEKGKVQVSVSLVWMIALLAVLVSGTAIVQKMYDAPSDPDIHFTTQPLISLPEGVYVINQQTFKRGNFHYLLISIDDKEPRIFPIRSKERLIHHAFEVKCEGSEMRLEPRTLRIKVQEGFEVAPAAPAGPVT